MSIRAADQSTDTVRTAIATAAARSGIDFNFLLAQARIESGLNPKARAATSTAAGLFQFTRNTWLETVERHGHAHGLGWAADAIVRNNGRLSVADAGLRKTIEGLRFEPEAASLMASMFAADNRDYLESARGRPTSDVDLYLAHFLGPQGALRFTEAFEADPHQSAAALFPTAASANRPVFFERDGRPRSLAEVRESFAVKLAEANAGSGAPPARAKVTQRSEDTSTTSRAPLAMLDFEPMPPRLSPDFVGRAYARLQAIAI